ncbi:DUF6888 family protein [Nostoc sp.]|uniref:DUF6888 family protein n=1 Tax=Nostoc sp. TaxID=1180 RepID=UPI003FA540BB
MPTPEQKTQCYILCCWFTKLYLPINIVRMDERTENLFFLAGEENIIREMPKTLEKQQHSCVFRTLGCVLKAKKGVYA